MSFRSYLLMMTLLTIVAWFGWGVVIWNVDPFASGSVGRGFFYVTLFVALVGTFSVGAVLLRTWRRPEHDLLFREVRVAFRHALMLAAVSVISLALAAWHDLTWWHLGILFAVICSLEYVFLLIGEGRRA